MKSPASTVLLALLLALLSPSSLGQNQCQNEYGSLAECIDESTCQTGTIAGKCPGAANIKCCTQFQMTNAFKFYEPNENPWQKLALDELQERLTWFSEFRTFSCMFRNKQPDGTYCGGEDGMDEIKLSNVAFYYNEEAHQISALNYLQDTLLKDALIADWLKFVQKYRNIGGSAPGGSFLPNAPDFSGHQGACSSPFNGYSGFCIPVSRCTGATFNGLCPGSSKCCVAETRPASPSSDHLSFSGFQRLFGGISATRAAAFWPYFNEAMDQILKDNPSSTTKCHRIAAFAAQIGHESAGLLYFEEIASGSAYNGRCRDLGNCQPNDGPRFKGRGPIQLTGRANYRRAGASLNLDFETRPEQVCFPSAGFKGATWFWTANNLNRYCTGNYNDFTALSVRINGGYNGITDRRNRWATAKSLLGCPQGLEESYVLQLAGIEGNGTEEDSKQFADEFCPEHFDSSSSSSGASTTVIIATVVPCTVLIVVAIGLATFFIIRKRDSVKV